MIPKIIHYCWFGKDPIPEESRQYIEEWKELNPGWTLHFWNESNSPMDAPYMQTAYQNRNWANMSNYIRLHSLTTHGGIYLDTDVKLIKSLDSVSENNCFVGFEEGEKGNEIFWVNNAICGAVKAHPFVLECYDWLLQSFDGTEMSNLSGPRLTTEVLRKKGLSEYGFQKIEDVTIYPKEYFYPIHYSEVYKLAYLQNYIFPETVAVHVWARTWLTKESLLYIIDDLYKLNNQQSAQLANYKAHLSKQDAEKDDKTTINDNKLSYQLTEIKHNQLFFKSHAEELSILVHKLSRKIDAKESQIKMLEELVRDREVSLEKTRSKEDELQNQVAEFAADIRAAKVKIDLLEQSRQEDLRTVTQLKEKEKELTEQITKVLAIADAQRAEKSVLADQADTLHKELRNIKRDLDQFDARKKAFEEETQGLKSEISKLKDDLQSRATLLSSTKTSYEHQASTLKNEIKILQTAVSWYKATFEKRSIFGIIKDRLVSKFPFITFINKWLNGYYKLKKARQSNGITKKILCTVVNYNFTNNALQLQKDLSEYMDTIVFDSGSKKSSRKFVNLGNVYYSGLLNHAYSCAKSLGYEYLFFICSDVEFKPEEIKKMISNLQKTNLEEIGIYSPSSTGRSHSFCKQVYPKGYRAVPFSEGFIFMADMKILDEFLPIDLNANLYGWGLDVANGFFSRKLNKLCVIDDEVSVYHPDSTGYSNQKAEDDMWRWLEKMNQPEFKNFFTTHIDIIRMGKADKIKVSVIVPCYNQARYLKETLYNLFLQEYCFMEILVVNDGSTDSSDVIAKEMATLFPQIKYIEKKNGGLGNARNFGLQKATGDVIQFLDADDLLSKDKFLNQVYSILQKPEIEVSYCPYICFEDGNDTNTWTYSRVVLNEDPLKDLIQNWEKDLSIPIHCFLYKKTAIGNLKFDEELPNHEDWLFHLEIAGKKPSYYFEPKGVALYRVRNNSMARNREVMIKGKLMCLQKAAGIHLLSDEYKGEIKKRIDLG